MTQTEHYAPKTLGEAIGLLVEYGDNAEVIAGGTDLLVRMKKGEDLKYFFISIDGIKDLDYIREDDRGGIRIGAHTSMRSLTESALVRKKFGVLACAAGMVGTPTIRNHATIGGNLCNAAPSADTAPPLIVLGAQLKIMGGDGEKVVPVDEFFTGPGETLLGRSEILTEIHLPPQPPGSKAVYLKQTRTRGADLALVGVAVRVCMKSDVVDDVRIALGAVAPTPVRAESVEALLKGKKVDDALLAECAEAASKEAKPIDDVRASADYRNRLIKVLVQRAIKEAI